MSKNYSISKTTRVQREKLANEALGLSTLDNHKPTEQAKNLVNKYIVGEMEIPDVLNAVLDMYRQ